MGRQGKPTSKSFAEWVRRNRIALRKDQGELGLSQQEISRIERLGFIPPTPKLKTLCDALGRTLAEAVELISNSVTGDLLKQMYDSMWAEFTTSVIEASRTAKTTNPLCVYVLREDSQPWDKSWVDWYYELLTNTTNLRLTILFRYANPIVSNSFQSLAGSLLLRWHQAGLELQDLHAKLSGCYRDPGHEEDSHLALPLVYSGVLVLCASGPQLYSISEDMRLMASSKETAQLITGWIGAEANLWVEIPWPVANPV